MAGGVLIFGVPGPGAKSEITSKQRNLFERYGYQNNRREKCYRMRCKSKVYCEQKENSKVGQFNRIRLDQEVGQKRQIWETRSKIGKRAENADLWENQEQ